MKYQACKWCYLFISHLSSLSDRLETISSLQITMVSRLFFFLLSRCFQLRHFATAVFFIGEMKILVLSLSSVGIERERVPMMPVISGNFLVCGTIFFP